MATDANDATEATEGATHATTSATTHASRGGATTLATTSGLGTGAFDTTCESRECRECYCSTAATTEMQRSHRAATCKADTVQHTTTSSSFMEQECSPWPDSFWEPECSPWPDSCREPECCHAL